MFIDFIKYYFILLFTIYILLKLLNNHTNNLKSHICIFLFAFVLALLPGIAFLTQNRVLYIAPIIVIWLWASLISPGPQISFIITTLAFGISYSCHALCSFISTLLLYLLTNADIQFSFISVAVLSSILHTVITIRILQIKRFQKGLPLLNKTSYLNTTTILCIFFIAFQIYPASSTESFQAKLLSFVLFIILLCFLIFWWQAQITKSYKQRLLMSELEARRVSDSAKDAEIERLSTILHRNANLLDALRDATINGLRTDFETEDEIIATRERLIANIEKVAEGCENISSDYRRKKARTFDTKLDLLDDLLHRLDGDAIEQQITFQVYIGVSLQDYVPAAISESDLVYTVNDLLKNAFKSTRTCEKRVVQLQFYKLDKHFVIEVSDNGIPFEVRSLVNMGIEKLTTYEDGSGIGLMDIWSTKERYRATYHLDEYATAAPFTKKISLTFDKKNRYSIRTWRKDEILKMSRRADLQVYEHAQ